MKNLLPGFAAICVAFGLVTGCARTDPYRRPGMWHPERVNAGNIAAEVQDPRDLVRGHAEPGPDWKTGTAAVNRLWDDKAKPLLSDTSAAPAAAGTPSPTGGQ